MNKKISLIIATIFFISSIANAQDHSAHKEEREDVAHSDAGHKKNMRAVDHTKKADKKRIKAEDHANEKHDAEMKKDSQKAGDEKAGNKGSHHNHTH